jgi:hypothetical protein
MHLCCILKSAHHQLFQYQPRHFTQRESLDDVLIQSIDWVHYCQLWQFSTKFKTNVNCVLHVDPSIKRRCIRSSNYVVWWFEIACRVFCNEAKMCVWAKLTSNRLQLPCNDYRNYSGVPRSVPPPRGYSILARLGSGGVFVSLDLLWVLISAIFGGSRAKVVDGTTYKTNWWLCL